MRSCYTDLALLQASESAGPSPTSTEDLKEVIASSSGQPKKVPQTEFFFVQPASSNPRSISKDKKSIQQHVQRDYQRRKRARDRERLARLPIGVSLLQPVSTNARARKLALPCHTKQENIQAPSVTLGTAHSPRKHETSKEHLNTYAMSLKVAPAGQGTIDPFQTLPVPLSKDQKALTHHSLAVLPGLLFPPTIRGKPHASNLFSDFIYPISMQSRIAFQTVNIAFSAYTRAWKQRQIESHEGLLEKNKAIAMLRQHFMANPRDATDDAITTSVIQGLIEDSAPDIDLRGKRAAQAHWRASRAMVRHRGGPQALHTNRAITAIFNQLEYLVLGYDEADSMEPNSALVGKDIGQSSRRYLLQECEAFINFLHNVEALAKVQSTSGCPRRHQMFQKDTSLYKMLIGTQAPSESSPFNLDFRSFMKYILIPQVVLPLLIHTALCDYQHSTELTDKYLKELAITIVKHDLDTHPARDTLIFQLVVGSFDINLYRPERAWFVGRILKIMKREAALVGESHQPASLHGNLSGGPDRDTQSLGR